MKIAKLGMNHPMGPLTVADFIGLDEDKYRPCPLVAKYVSPGAAGALA